MEIKKVQMGLSEETVGKIASIQRMLKVANKTEAVAFAVKLAEMLIESKTNGQHLFIGDRFGNIRDEVSF